MKSHQEWKPAGGIDLEPNADIACREPIRSLAITAGPGAGKTELLAQRADFLLRTNTCPYPKRILAISFKVDAATNLAARVRERISPDLASRLDSHTFHAFAHRLIQQFRPVLTGPNQLDPGFTLGEQRISRSQITFKDLIPLAIEILENSPLVRAGLRATYSDVFLDEFQDCTQVQYELIRTSFFGTSVRLTAVGDTKQRIMGWAGALEGVFETLAHDFDALPLNLYQNRRSAPRLRRMQNRMIMDMDPVAAVPEASLPGDGGHIHILHAADQDEEATQITDWIQNLITNGIPESEIAILYSKQAEHYGISLFQALDAAGIGYRNEQKLQELAAQPLTNLLLSYLQLLVSDRSPSAYVRLKRSQLFVIHGETDLIRLRTKWERHVKAAQNELRDSIAVSDDRRTLQQLINGFIDFFGAGAVAALHPEYESANRVNDLVAQLIERILELLAGGSSLIEALGRFVDEPGVRVMSIHKSKGLEFTAVVVAAVEHEMFWSDLEAERASFFVAIARAKEHLLLTHVTSRARPPGASRWYTQRNPHREFLDYARE